MDENKTRKSGVKSGPCNMGPELIVVNGVKVSPRNLHLPDILPISAPWLLGRFSLGGQNHRFKMTWKMQV